MASITFDTDDYYDDDALTEMIDYETRHVIREHVMEMLGFNNGINNLVYNVATHEIENILDEIIPDYKDKVAEQVCDAIDKLGKFDMFYHSDKATQIIDETIEKIRPILQEKAKRIALETIEEQIDAEQIIAYVCDEFYNIVRKQLRDE